VIELVAARPALRRLSLRDYGFDLEESRQLLANLIHENTTLEWLDLSGTVQTLYGGGKRLAAALAANTTLRHLVFRNNLLSRRDGDDIAQQAHCTIDVGVQLSSPQKQQDVIVRRRVHTSH